MPVLYRWSVCNNKTDRVGIITIEVDRYIVESERSSMTLSWKLSPILPEMRGPGSCPFATVALYSFVSSFLPSILCGLNHTSELHRLEIRLRWK